MAYYNTDLLTAAGVAKIPETWDEFADAMKKVTAYGKSKGQFNGAFALNRGASNVDFNIMSRGGKLISDDQTKLLFNSDQGVAALQFDADLVKAGAAYLYNGFDWQNDLAAQKTDSTLDSSTGYAFVDPLVKKAPTRSSGWLPRLPACPARR
jgi:ABC-type glycerol-3-phosphate transport system substrate-binding protein